MVVLDKHDYINKAQDLLGQSATYRIFAVRVNPQTEKQTHQHTQQREEYGTTPTKDHIPQEQVPKFYGLPKIYRKETSLGP